MDIRKRINARKIVLSYFYQHCFFSLLKEKGLPIPSQKQYEGTTLIEASDSSIEQGQSFLGKQFIETAEAKKKEMLEWDDKVVKSIEGYANLDDIEGTFPYFLKYFFDQWSEEDVDVEYVLKIGASLKKYESELIKKVNKHTATFGFKQMDPLDEALLLLGYIENKVLGTHKVLVINEMIELAKRYADEGSPKLINGLLHGILTEEENNN